MRNLFGGPLNLIINGNYTTNVLSYLILLIFYAQIYLRLLMCKCASFGYWVFLLCLKVFYWRTLYARNQIKRATQVDQYFELALSNSQVITFTFLRRTNSQVLFENSSRRAIRCIELGRHFQADRKDFDKFFLTLFW